MLTIDECMLAMADIALNGDPSGRAFARTFPRWREAIRRGAGWSPSEFERRLEQAKRRLRAPRTGRL